MEVLRCNWKLKSFRFITENLRNQLKFPLDFHSRNSVKESLSYLHWPPWRKLCLLNRVVPLQNCLWNNFIKPLYDNSPSIVSAFRHTQPLTPELLWAILPSQEQKALGLTINTAAPIVAQTSTTVIEDSMPRKIKKRKGRGIGAYNLHLRPNIGNTMK